MRRRARAFQAGVRSTTRRWAANDEAAGYGLGPQRLLGIAPSAGAAIAGMANDFDARPGVRLLDGLHALAATGGIGVEPLQLQHLGHGLRDHGRGGRRDRSTHTAEVTVSASNSPKVSTAMWLLARALTFLGRVEARRAACVCGAARALAASMMAALGSQVATDALTPLPAQSIVHGLEGAGRRAQRLNRSESAFMPLGPTVSPASIRATNAQRDAALARGALGLGRRCGSSRLMPAQPQRLANRDRAHCSARAPLQLPRHLIDRRARLLSRKQPARPRCAAHRAPASRPGLPRRVLSPSTVARLVRTRG